MPQDFNQVIFTGRLGQDPDMSYTTNGNAVTKFSIAVNGRKRGENQETFWYNIVCWQKLAEIVNQYARKGSKVLVQGELVQRKYTDKQGVNRVAFEVIASTVQLLDSKPKEQQPSSFLSETDDLGELDDHPF